MVRFLSDADRLLYRGTLTRAWQTPNYEKAKRGLMQVHTALVKRNRSAASCLLEGLEETLTVHGASVYAALGKSLRTTSCVGHVSRHLTCRLRQFSHWLPPEWRDAYMALELLELESRMRRIAHATYLPTLRTTLFGTLQTPSGYDTRTSGARKNREEPLESS